jgi:hypothetical protein
MIDLKAVGLGALAVGTAAVANETHIASVEVIKYVGTVCTALYAIGTLVRAVWRWWKHEFHTSVADIVDEQISKKLGHLPCAQNDPCNFEVTEEGRVA